VAIYSVLIHLVDIIRRIYVFLQVRRNFLFVDILFLSNRTNSYYLCRQFYFVYFTELKTTESLKLPLQCLQLAKLTLGSYVALRYKILHVISATEIHHAMK